MTWRASFFAFIRRALLGAAAGGIAGMLVGGIGGRLAMLLLRFTSPGSVRGTLTDDEFEIGVVTFDTLNLVATTWALGAIAGLFVALALRFMPGRWAVWAWAAPGATLGGAGLIHGDGVDFTVLEPAWLAVLLFIVIPAAGLVLTAALVRSWERWWWVNRRRTLLVVVAAAPVAALFPVGLAVIALGAAYALVARNPLAEEFANSAPVRRAAVAVFSLVTIGFAPVLAADVAAVL
ncbi:MAG TPA: hypothetical protein PKK39_04300 [Tepidiformaceae bacterium]|nr:hypothetical protein [Tepidiformaceae bacterium]